MYADFEYYRLTFGGTAIGEKEYPAFAVQADALIDRLTFGRLRQGWAAVTAVKMAACALAEELFEQKELKAEIKRGVQSENTDGYAVTYTETSKRGTLLFQKQLEAVDLYLPPSHPLRYSGFYGRGCQC